MHTQSNTNNAPTALVCRHIHTIGRRCDSPCLRGEEFCYFHHTTRRPPKAPSTGADAFFAGPDTFDIPSFEDRPAIQLTILEIARRIASKTIDLKHATKLLDACKAASLNLTREERAAAVRSPSSVSRSRSRTNEERTTKNEQLQQLPSPQPIEIVQEVTFSPTLGPLAPVLEYGLPEPEEEQEPSLASRIYSWLNAPPPPEPVPLERRPYDFDTLQLLRRTLATTTNPETAARIRKALEEEALLPNHNLHIQACAEPVIRSPLSVPRSRTKRHRTTNNEERTTGNEKRTTTDNQPQSRAPRQPHRKIWKKRWLKNYRKPASGPALPGLVPRRNPESRLRQTNLTVHLAQIHTKELHRIRRMP
jgi:hypothetical protein